MPLQGLDISLNIRNNTNYPQQISVMGNPSNLLDTSNATTEYRWDLTGFVITFENTVSVQYKRNTDPSFDTFTWELDGTSLQSVVIALNNLGIGFFNLYDELGNTYIGTYNENYAFGDLNIFNPTISTTTTTTTTTIAPTTTTTTTSTTTAAPTTSTTTSTTTAAPTTSTTTSTTTAPLTSTTTSTTTAAPTTSTTTSTTTAAPTTSTTTSTTTAAPTTSTTTSTTTVAPTTSTTTSTTTAAPTTSTTTSTTTAAPTTSTTTTTTTLALNVYLCVNNGGVFPYPVSAGNGSASGTLYNNSGGIVYIYGVFNSGGNSSGSVNNDSGVVNGSNLVFSGTVTSAGQTILSTTEVALNDGDFVTWSLSKQDTLSSGATLRLGYALTIGGAVTNIAENCVVPPTTTTTTTTTTAAPTTTTTTTTTSSTSTTTTAAPLPANIQITNGSLDVAISQVDFNGVTATYVAGQPLPNTTGNGTDLNTTQIGTYTLDVYRNNSVAGQHITVTDSNGTPQCIFFSSGAATESYFGVVYDGVTNIQIDVQDGSC